MRVKWNKRISLVVVAVLFLTSALFAIDLLSDKGNTASAAGPYDPNTEYRLINRNSGKSLDVAQSSTANGGNVHQWSYWGGNNQLWNIIDVGNGYHKIINLNSGKALDISGGSTANGGNAIQWTDHGGNNQQWQIIDVGGGYDKLMNRNSGLLLDISGGSTADGGNAIQWSDNGGNNQQWQIVPVNMPIGNPTLPGYNADPKIAFFDGKYYIYPTTDGIASWGSTSFKAYSSTDLINWTDEGVILDLADVSWVSSSAWAPSIAYRNGTYYFYFTAGNDEIGVATSSSPTGPFVDKGSPLISAGQFGTTAIDPEVFIDDDGQAYLYFGNPNCYVIRLNSNMTSLSGSAVNITPPYYREGAAVFKRNGNYYLMYSENDTRSEDYRVRYSIASSPMGPFTQAPNNPVLSKNLSLGIKATGHNSVLKIPSRDEYYIAYHRFSMPDGDGTHREVMIDRMYFESNGNITTVVPTLNGITSPVSP